jgi:hypothetical protein
MGLLGIFLSLGVLIGLSFRGWSVLVLAPAAALVAALASGAPLLAHWTQTFMVAAAGFVAQFFPLFLLGAVFGKLMDDSGSVGTIARFMTEKMGAKRAMLAVVLAGAIVTYGGVSLFVAFFVIVPMAQGLFREPTGAGGRRARNLYLHDVGDAGHACRPERHPDAFLRYDALCRAGARHHCIGHHAGVRTLVAGTGRTRGAACR